MSDAPDRIWVEPPYFTVHGKIPEIVWEPQWDSPETAQAFDYVRSNGVEYIRADIVTTVKRRRLASLVETWKASPVVSEMLSARHPALDADDDYRISAATRAEWAERAMKAEAERDRLLESLEQGVDLIKGDLTGGEWKKACHAFTSGATAAIRSMKKEPSI